jgi:hypothetical protein
VLHPIALSNQEFMPFSIFPISLLIISFCYKFDLFLLLLFFNIIKIFLLAGMIIDKLEIVYLYLRYENVIMYLIVICNKDKEMDWEKLTNACA